jgi:hypothetical protein
MDIHAMTTPKKDLGVVTVADLDVESHGDGPGEVILARDDQLDGKAGRGRR